MRRAASLGLPLASAAAPAVALAHDGAPLAPHDLWTAWTADPWILVPLLVMAASYAFGLRALWTASGTGRGIRRREALAFAVGWVLLALALLSPLHALGEALFSAHMVQHEVMMVVAAPLLVLGRPFVAFVWALPSRSRRPVMTRLRGPRLLAAWRWIAAPFVAWTAHATAIWLWHLPSLYQRTVDEPAVHALQHLSFVSTGLLFWWALLRGSRMGAGPAIAYLFTTMLHTGALGVLLAFASGLWYPVYATSTVAWGLSPMEDQQLGGLIMWIPGGIAYVLAALVLLTRWMHASEARVRLGERLDAATAGARPGRGAVRYETGPDD